MRAYLHTHVCCVLWIYLHLYIHVLIHTYSRIVNPRVPVSRLRLAQPSIAIPSWWAPRKKKMHKVPSPHNHSSVSKFYHTALLHFSQMLPFKKPTCQWVQRDLPYSRFVNILSKSSLSPSPVGTLDRSTPNYSDQGIHLIATKPCNVMYWGAPQAIKSASNARENIHPELISLCKARFRYPQASHSKT